MSLSVDRETFYRRIKRFFAGWNKETQKLGEADAVIIAVGKNDEDQYRLIQEKFIKTNRNPYIP
jgi:hypothetical protein